MIGSSEAVADLVERGAAPPSLAGVDAFVAAALAADTAALAALDDVVADARAQRPGLVVWAAGLGRRDAIPLLVARGLRRERARSLRRASRRAVADGVARGRGAW